ncbi:MAG: alanine--tRNA ligase [Thermofilaceae archaeon]
MGEEEFLHLPFFKENGFLLKKCKLCGKSFWTLNPEQDVCGDQPCTDYEFVGEGLVSLFNEPRNVREAFLTFFEKEGHARISRYPVVARWRDDVYLVGASIYDFQPWVTEGIVEPPANPLVISQPSIRLTDLENVGRSGRHLTGFEMMAHHAFNIGDKTVYWADETVRYAFRVLTEVFKIPPEQISFKFDWWSGGGNAGEDYEVLVKGLEVATLVFMHYRVVGEKFVPMPNRIVDTGYGLERLLWLLKGTPTVYDAVFPSIIDQLMREAGLKPLDPKIALAVARKSGKLDFKRPLEAQRQLEQIAESLEVSLEELKGAISPYHDLFALVDHTRTILWMIGDGVVPSNVGAGYLARLLIRRALRHLWKLRIEKPLAEIVARQIRHWSLDFPEYREIEDEIIDIVSYEEKRFLETLQQGKRTLARLARELKAKGRSELPANLLAELYESHGLPPEIVAEELSTHGLVVNVPVDFYLTLVSKHQEAKRLEERVGVELDKLIEGLKPTEKLYYIDPRMLQFDAIVLRSEGNRVILDRTAFYPEGGGQPHDLGILSWEDGMCHVVRVLDVRGIVIHECEGPVPPTGAKVKGLVNAERRFALMRNHTATHIVLGAARRVLGKHVWQAGAQKGVEQSRLDITHHKKITPEELKQIERLANLVVMENRPVRAFFEDRSKAEMKYGFTLYQGGVVPGARLRIVEIEGWDVEACGGVHCSSTGEVGFIKIIKAERIQDGVSRLIFKVGSAAVEYAQQLEESLSKIADILGTEQSRVVDSVSELLKERDALAKELKELKGRLLDAEAARIASQAEQIAGFNFVAILVEENDVKEFALRVAKNLKRAVVGVVNRKGSYAIKVSDELVGEGLDARKLNEELLRRVNGRGGGAPDLVSGKVEEPLAFCSALRDALLLKAQPH